MNTNPLRGTRDLTGREKEELDRIRQTILDRFRLYGYARVEPPILEGTEPFLERSGEEIRRRMYSFQDPSGRDICLRPELTIPTCRLFLDRLYPNPDFQRVCYDGIVLRYDPVSFGRLREFRQVGIEHFGNADPAASDAEAVALAIESITACGLNSFHVVMNDIEIVAAILDELKVVTPLRDRIWQRLQSADQIEAILRDVNGSCNTVELDGTELSGLAETMDPMILRQFVVNVLALSHGNLPSSRSAQEIAERLVSKIERRVSRPLSKETAETLKEILSIKGEASTALDSLQRIASKDQFTSIIPLIDRFRRRLDFLDASGVDTASMILKLSLRRSLQYYTGFIFEIHEPVLGGASEICGGGRYDRLLKSMGASSEIPAVGFAIGADRVQLGIDARQVNAISNSHHIDVIVAPVGSTGLKECFHVSDTFRKAGWSVETELTGRRPRSVIAKANRMHVRFVAFVGDDEVARAGVSIKDLASRNEQLVKFEQLKSFVDAARPIQDGGNR